MRLRFLGESASAADSFAVTPIFPSLHLCLSLNQTKISGVCGRLMCCLKNEQETYEALNKSLPGTGDTVTLPDGLQGIVHSVNVLRQRVKVIVEVNDEKEIQEYPVGELKFRSRKKKAKNTDKETRDIE